MALSRVCHGALCLILRLKFYSVLLGSSCINASLAEVGCERLVSFTDFQFHLNGRLGLSWVGNMQIGRFCVDVFTINTHGLSTVTLNSLCLKGTSFEESHHPDIQFGIPNSLYFLHCSDRISMAFSF